MTPEPPTHRPPLPGAGQVRKPAPRRRNRGPTGPVCLVCQKPMDEVMARLADTHPCCDPYDTKERR